MRGIFDYLIVLLFLGIGVVSCKQDFDEPVYVFNIDDEFSLSMKEKFSPDKREFAFNIKSIRGFNCEDIRLSAVSSMEGNIVDIYIGGFSLAGECMGGEYYPEKDLIVGELSEGEYLLNIYFQGNIQNELRLKAEGKTYQIIEEEELVGLSLPYNILNKTPERTIWGNLSYNEEQANFLKEELLNTLSDQGLSEFVFSDGVYSSFVVEDGKIVSGDFSTTLGIEDYIALNYSQINAEEMEAALDEFIHTYSEQFEFNLELSSSEGWEF